MDKSPAGGNSRRHILGVTCIWSILSPLFPGYYKVRNSPLSHPSTVILASSTKHGASRPWNKPLEAWTKTTLSLSDCCCQVSVSTMRLLTSTITAACCSVDKLQKQCQRQERLPKPPTIGHFSEMRSSRGSHPKKWTVKGRGEEPMGTCLKCASVSLSWSRWSNTEEWRWLPHSAVLNISELLTWKVEIWCHVFYYAFKLGFEKWL